MATSTSQRPRSGAQALFRAGSVLLDRCHNHLALLSWVYMRSGNRSLVPTRSSLQKGPSSASMPPNIAFGSALDGPKLNLTTPQPLRIEKFHLCHHPSGHSFLIIPRYQNSPKPRPQPEPSLAARQGFSPPPFHVPFLPDETWMPCSFASPRQKLRSPL
ncbi:hypothetical protein GE09DRAFT_368603 [Coniochaeta sp. 2T2.1]|nr:hypothetical protein GE09DRAFT_368603 [Coniochaeta sp. 2T2.1]